MTTRREFIEQSFLAAMGLSMGKFIKIRNPDGEEQHVYESIKNVRTGFHNPPPTTQPGVYWYFMDGNLSGKGMTADLEAMKKAGINNVVFLEVNVGVPRGPVDFLSEEWLSLFRHAVKECERLDIRMTMGVGPGWTGSGGPWVKGKDSMQHLVSTETMVEGSSNVKVIHLAQPKPKKPYFGEGALTPDLKERREKYYEDVAVLAYPTPASDRKIEDIDRKALYYRDPYTSKPGVAPFYPSPAIYSGRELGIKKNKIVDLTDKMQADGSLRWEMPAGKWTIMRFGVCNNGAVTRPAPLPGLGFECDKFDAKALDKHLEEYLGKIFDVIGEVKSEAFGGLKMLHMDSWEMGAQNWTQQFRDKFKQHRGYDPLPFFPVYQGYIVESHEISERFLWDLRLTSQELILDNHARHLKSYAHEHGLGLSIEPYDMNPTADLELGNVADVPMCEFWSEGFGFNSTFSCIEATSIAHVKSQPVVQAEAFTADGNEAWKQYPGSMKEQGDWAFAAGINRFFYHTFAHKPLDENLRPGMNMGPYGVHWDRKQTWWSMADGYHQYISRCQFVLQQGGAVSDLLFLTPEGAPQVFVPPASALEGEGVLPDRRGYNFDGCSPGQLMKASVAEGKVIFPGGASYRLLILPVIETMTPRLLKKVQSLVENGATVVGTPPKKSPSLVSFPACDHTIRSVARELWGGFESPENISWKNYGKGRVIWGGELSRLNEDEIYPAYQWIAQLLKEAGIQEDFKSDQSIRYTHRSSDNWDIYFVANKTAQPVKTECTFRAQAKSLELWDPLTDTIRPLPEFTTLGSQTTIPLKFDAFQSYFIVFRKDAPSPKSLQNNSPQKVQRLELQGPWSVSFDPQWGGPKQITFNQLIDWTTHSNDGIKYYSGIAVYEKRFDLMALSDADSQASFFLSLGELHHMARVHLNGKDLGVIWTAPWQVDITHAVQQKENKLKIEVANLWPNRLIGDKKFKTDEIVDGKWPEWLLNGEKRPGKRYSFSTYHPYKADSPLIKSGLLGPATIQEFKF